MKILEIKTEKRQLGNFGERRAVRLLKRKGYRILKKNYVALGHEIDIVAKNKKMLVFVEVKTRSSTVNSQYSTRPAAAVTPDKQMAIIKAARYYMGGRKYRNEKILPVRFDVVEVIANQNKGKYYEAEIKHLEGAFNLNTAKGN